MNINRKQFFDGVKARLDPTLSQEQVDGFEFLLGQFEQEPRWNDIRLIAYAFATIWHETAYSMQPVEECYYLGSKAKAAQKKLRYYPYFGRGLVQLTWRTGYEKAGKALGVDLVNNPNLATDPHIAFRVLTEGLFRGWFGGKLTTYITDTKTDYVNARRCVNILDKAGIIAGYARSFEKVLAVAASASETVAPTNDIPIETAASSLPPDDQTSPTGSEQPPTQDINTPAEIDAAKPYNEIGLKDTLKGDAKAILPANVGLQTVSEWIQQTTGWPAWVTALLPKIALIALCATVVWILYRFAAWVMHHWAEKERIRLMAMINSDVTRRDVTIR